MKTLVISFSKTGALLSLKIKAHYGKEADVISTYQLENTQVLFVEKIKNYVKDVFHDVDLIIFIGATGIAVRMIAPCIKDKYSDPAVLVIDESGRFVISLLSGHLGGANQYAQEIGELLGSVPVITTASEQYGLLAPDLFAQREKLTIQNRNHAKIAASFLNEKRNILILNQTGYEYPHPQEYQLISNYEENEGKEPCICITYKRLDHQAKICYLVPKVLSLGIGCRKGTTCEHIRESVKEVFEKEGLFIEAVKSIGTIDLKKEEEGLLQYGEEMGLPIRYYSSQELMGVLGEFSRSSFVESITGVDNVCERAAVKQWDNGVLIVKKQSMSGVTVAVAIDKGAIKWDN